MNSSQQPQAAPGNRITFTSQPIPNGTINLNTGHQVGPTIISTSQLPNTTTIKTITSTGAGGASGGGAGQHHGLVQHHQQMLQTTTAQPGQSVQQQQQQQQHQQQQQQQQQSGNQPLLNSMIPANVVVGMRPQSGQQQGKNVQGNTLGRVVIGNPHMVGTRPQSPAITLSTLTPGQAPALILKTENGFQLLRVGTATSSNPVTQTIGTNSNNPTQIRLQTVPAATIATTSTANNIVVNSVATTNSTPHVFTTQANISLQQQHHQQQQHQHQQQHQQQSIQQQTQHLHPQPQITQIQTIPAQQNQQHQHQQQQQQQQQLHTAQQQQQQANLLNNNNNINNNNNNINNNNNNLTNASSVGGTIVTTTTTTTGGVTTPTTPQQTSVQGNTKEKCRKFLANLIDLSTREPKPVEKNVRNLIQELVNANVEPEQFCERLERLLNASPQPCLIGFLKKSLPLLRQALLAKELVIEGIKPPPHHVVYPNTIQQHMFPKIQAQIRPISQNQSTTIGQTHVRVVTPSLATSRLVNPTLATANKQGTIRIQNSPNGPRLISTPIRGPIPATIQQQTQPQTNSQLPQTVAAVPSPSPTGTNSLQIRGPGLASITRPATVQIRTGKGGKNATVTTGTSGTATPPALATGGGNITHVKVGQTQIKTIPATTTPSKPPSLIAFGINSTTTATITSTTPMTKTSTLIAKIPSTTTGSGTVGGLPISSLPTVQLPSGILNSSSNSIDLKDPTKQLSTPATPTSATSIQSVGKTVNKLNTSSSSKASSKKKKDTQDRDKDEKNSSGISSSSSSAASSAFFQHSSVSSTLYGDDDINDVAAMGGVNLAEESQRILGCTENIGTQIRSCKDEVFLHLPALHARIRNFMLEKLLDEPTNQDVDVLISHACQEHLKNIVEKLAVIAEHRIDVIKMDPRYEVTKDVRGQIKFLEEVDKAEQKRHEELEREMLLRAAKSRSKVEDPEQAKIKARAKEMQRAEMEELRQRDANMTALQAIGPRKKLKLDEFSNTTSTTTGNSGVLGTTGAAPATLRPRIKRINLRDMQFYMEQDRDLCRSEMLYKAYLK